MQRCFSVACVTSGVWYSQIAIQQGALMLERFYPSHVLQRLPIHEEDFWESKGLSVNDWAGLAGLIYADIFSLDFLTPLDDTDTRFRLEVCCITSVDCGMCFVFHCYKYQIV